jgi:hypothetical protein
MVRHTHLVGRGSTGGRSVAHRVGARITDERKGVRGADHRHRDRPGAARRIVPSPTHSRSAIRRSWSTEGRVDDSSTPTAGPILILVPPGPWSDWAIATSGCSLPWLPSSSAPPSAGLSRNRPAGSRVGREADRPRARRPGEKGLVRTLQFGRQRGGHASPAASNRPKPPRLVCRGLARHSRRDDGTVGAPNADGSDWQSERRQGTVLRTVSSALPQYDGESHRPVLALPGAFSSGQFVSHGTSPLSSSKTN